MQRSFLWESRRHRQFFESTSFSARLSSVGSATACFWFPFSSARCSSFLASLLSIQPYFLPAAIGLSLIPCCRYSSAVVDPASPLKLPGLERFVGTGFTADSRHVLFNGNEPGHKVRAYALDPASGKIEPLTPEGVRAFPSADGKFLVELSDNARPQILRLGFNEPAREIKGREDQDIGIQVAPDGNVRSSLSTKNRRLRERLSH